MAEVYRYEYEGGSVSSIRPLSAADLARRAEKARRRLEAAAKAPTLDDAGQRAAEAMIERWDSEIVQADASAPKSA
ncbi:hypothetical protein [Zavarzinia sp.]|uniref:hypothetical protein n=1 Tax=Zavarzinia sp. TaxID=2027920 RepID=UPI003BB7D216